MNPSVILALISDLYAQNDALQRQLAATLTERDKLKAQLAGAGTQGAGIEV